MNVFFGKRLDYEEPWEVLGSNLISQTSIIGVQINKLRVLLGHVLKRLNNTGFVNLGLLLRLMVAFLLVETHLVLLVKLVLVTVVDTSYIALELTTILVLLGISEVIVLKVIVVEVIVVEVIIHIHIVEIVVETWVKIRVISEVIRHYHMVLREVCINIFVVHVVVRHYLRIKVLRHLLRL